MFNILHLRDTVEIGGPGKTIFETVNTIKKDKYNIHIGVFTRWAENNTTPFIKEARNKGYNLHLIKSFNQFDPLILVNTLFLVKKLNIHIIHSHEFLSDVISMCIGGITKIPIITTLHGWICNTRKDQLYVKLDQKIIKRFDRVIVVSEDIKKKLQNSGISEQKIAVLHNCIKSAAFKKQGKKGYLNELIGVKLKKPVIGTIGRLSAEKGHEDFIEAAGIVIKKGYSANFILVGDGPDRKKLQDKIDHLNLSKNIFITGYVNDIRKVYEDLDLMILPSYTEGLPNVILEALSMEVPVIATAVGGTPEIIESPEIGVLVPPRQPEQLANAIITFLENTEKFKRKTRFGSILIEKKFNFIERTKKLEKIYDEVVLGRGII
jgi:glycosyltransferase involved in cell wall biosynthesis